jgi:signal transduction histidine kinase
VNSLRARLIVAFSVVAIVPLAIAMTLLGGRIESMVREEAEERLGGTLGTLRERMAGDRSRLEERLEILARDASLKRLYLLGNPHRDELRQFIDERRILLGLDFLSVYGTTGTAVEGTMPGAELTQEGSAPLTYQGEVVGFVRGGVFLHRPFLERLGAGGGIELILRRSDRAPAATTLPQGAKLPTWPAGVGRVAIDGERFLAREIAIDVGPGAESRAYLTGLVSTAPADRAIASLWIATAVLAAFGVLLAVLLGLFWSSQVSRPVERLAAFAGTVAEGSWDEPLHLRSVRELETLVEALDRMRRDLGHYREKLVVSERQAAWSQMARKVAHEVKNPLTPIAISVADLKRSYEQKRPDFPQILEQAVRTITEEIETLKGLLQEFSDFARFPAPRLARVPLASLTDGLAALYAAEASQGRFAVGGAPPGVTLSADTGQMRQALINLIQNARDAAGAAGRVTVDVAVEADRAVLSVSDDGPGLDDEQRARLFVPGFTTKVGGSGLGLAIVERIVSEHEGTIDVESSPGLGTTFRIRLPLETGTRRPAAEPRSA